MLVRCGQRVLLPVEGSRFEEFGDVLGGREPADVLARRDLV